MKYAVAVILGAASAYEYQWELKKPETRETQGQVLGQNALEMNEALQKASVEYLNLHEYFEKAIEKSKI